MYIFKYEIQVALRTLQNSICVQASESEYDDGSEEEEEVKPKKKNRTVHWRKLKPANHVCVGVGLPRGQIGGLTRLRYVGLRVHSTCLFVWQASESEYDDESEEEKQTKKKKAGGAAAKSVH